jgi:hypothetical protein
MGVAICSKMLVAHGGVCGTFEQQVLYCLDQLAARASDLVWGVEAVEVLCI